MHDGPFECFVNKGKAGSTTSEMAEGLGRMVSLVLRMEDGLSAKERTELVIDQLLDIGGMQPLGTDARSVPDAVAKALAKHIGIWEGE